MNNLETLGQRISYLRTKCGLSQRRLMDELGFENLSKYEKDKREPKIDVLKALANYFHISLDWLLNGSEYIHPNGLTEREIQIIKQLRQLDKNEQTKIEGMIELKLVEAGIHAFSLQKELNPVKPNIGNFRPK